MTSGVVAAWLVYVSLIVLILVLARREDGQVSGAHLALVGSLVVLAGVGAWRASLTGLSPWLVPLAATGVALLVLVWSRGKPASFYRRRLERMEMQEAEDEGEP